MKKIYLSLVTVSLCAASIGQSVIQEAVTFKHLDQTGPKTTPMLNLSEKGATLHSWDFSDPYVNWTRSNTSSPAQGFWFPNDPEVGPVAALNPAGMATAANGFAYINSDSSGERRYAKRQLNFSNCCRFISKSSGISRISAHLQNLSGYSYCKSEW